MARIIDSLGAVYTSCSLTIFRSTRRYKKRLLKAHKRLFSLALSAIWLVESSQEAVFLGSVSHFKYIFLFCESFLAWNKTTFRVALQYDKKYPIRVRYRARSIFGSLIICVVSSNLMIAQSFHGRLIFLIHYRVCASNLSWHL